MTTKIQSLQEKINALNAQLESVLEKEQEKAVIKSKSAWILKQGKWSFAIPSEEDTAIKWDKENQKCVLLSGELPEQVPVCFKSHINKFVKSQGYARPDTDSLFYVKK